eukprot:snap_masked-scaffold_8-processed-gene-8.20-mRNA-1 protein AED:1.00 eAED:1.00 QI:0/-1/0/0/-1/1/1/0/717
MRLKELFMGTDNSKEKKLDSASDEVQVENVPGNMDNSAAKNQEVHSKVKESIANSEEKKIKNKTSGNISGYIDEPSTTQAKTLPAAEEGSSEKTEDEPGNSTSEDCSKIKLGKQITDIVADVIKENCLEEMLPSLEKSDNSSSNLCSSNTSSLTKPLKAVKQSPLVSSNPMNKDMDESAVSHKDGEDVKERKLGRRRYSAEALKYYKQNMHTYNTHQKETNESMDYLREGTSTMSYASKVKYSYNPRRKNSYNEAMEEDLRPQRDKLLRKQVAFAVDETVCGLVIGKGGVNVKKLEKMLGVEIIVNAKKDENATKRIVTILGTNPAAIQRARDELDFQQVFIPVLGPYQMRLVAKASQDKFQKWRVESGCTRVEFEHTLDDYDPQKHSNITHHDAVEMLDIGYSTRQKIQLKKQEATNNHNGFLRLVGTKEAVKKGQIFIENELDRANKIGMFDPKTKKEEVENTNFSVMNMDTNYSRNAHFKSQNRGIGYGVPHQGMAYEPHHVYEQKKYNLTNGQPYANNTTGTVVYQLWKQQQELQQLANDNRANLANLNMNLQPQAQRMSTPYQSYVDSQKINGKYAQGYPAAHQFTGLRRNSVQSVPSVYDHYNTYYGQSTSQSTGTTYAAKASHTANATGGYSHPQVGQNYQYSGNGRGRFRVVGQNPQEARNPQAHPSTLLVSDFEPVAVSEPNKNLDDMLLEGKMSVDEYAIKLAKADN